MTRDRRAAGVIIGALLGLAYLLVSQLINRIALPGIPLYQPPLGPLGNILLGGLVGAALGGLAAWPESPSLGVIAGSVTAGIGILVATSAGLGFNSAAGVIFSLILSVPLVWVIVPVILALRWTADRQAEARRHSVPRILRLRVPLALTLFVMLLALLDLLPSEGRTELSHMHTLVRAGLSATDSAAVPAPLRSRAVIGFPIGQPARYTLEWTTYDLDRFIELRPAGNYSQHAAVIARFRDGPLLVCLYPTPKIAPQCATYPP